MAMEREKKIRSRVLRAFCFPRDRFNSEEEVSLFLQRRRKNKQRRLSVICLGSQYFDRIADMPPLYTSFAHLQEWASDWTECVFMCLFVSGTTI